MPNVCVFFFFWYCTDGIAWEIWTNFTGFSFVWRKENNKTNRNKVRNFAVREWVISWNFCVCLFASSVLLTLRISLDYHIFFLFYLIWTVNEAYFGFVKWHLIYVSIVFFVVVLVRFQLNEWMNEIERNLFCFSVFFFFIEIKEKSWR